MLLLILWVIHNFLCLITGTSILATFHNIITKLVLHNSQHYPSFYTKLSHFTNIPYFSFILTNIPSSPSLSQTSLTSPSLSQTSLTCPSLSQTSLTCPSLSQTSLSSPSLSVSLFASVVQYTPPNFPVFLNHCLHCIYSQPHFPLTS